MSNRRQSLLWTKGIFWRPHHLCGKPFGVRVLVQLFLSFADGLHRITAAACLVLMTILFLAEIIIVLLRYVFGIGFLELQDIVSYSFAVLVVLGLPVTLRLDKHVRVDVFRDFQSVRTARLSDTVAICALLIPVFGMTLYFVMPDIVYAWSIREGSVETGGLPGYFVVKTALPLSYAMMIIQGIAMMLGAKNPGTTDGLNANDR